MSVKRARRIFNRRSTSLFTLATVVVAGIGWLGAARPAPAHASTISVPRVPAQQPALTMQCGVGQIDLNHATAADLQRLPGVSVPIAQRIIAQRPHDRTKDLLVVPGIGPDKLAAIDASGLACATPLTTPPPADHPCTSASQIDVNDPASQAKLADLFGGPTAARIVAAQPFPDLNHTLVVLAAGAGSGKVDKYATQLCVTPEPKIFNGVEYAYVYGGTGGRNDYQGFSLVVPPGVLTATPGQWTAITPQHTPTPDLPGLAWPSADFQTFGPSWQNGTKQVYVSLPEDPALAQFGPGFEPVIAHWSDLSRQTGEELAGDALLVNGTGGTVTAAVTHLSLIDSISRAVQWPVEIVGNLVADARFPAPSCDGTWALDSSSGDWSKDGGRIHLDSAYLNLPGNPVPPLGWPIKHCVGSGASTDGRLDLLNNTRTMMSLTAYDGTTPKLGDVNVGGDLLQLALADGAAALTGHPYAYPGGEVTATVPRGSFNAVQMKPAVFLTLLWAALDQSPYEELLKKLPKYGPVLNAVRAGAECVMNAYGVAKLDSSSTPQADATAILGYIENCFTPQEFWQLIADGVSSGAISGDLANAVSSTLDKISRYSIWVRIGQVSLTGVDSLLNATGSSAGIIGISYYTPRPTLDQQGRPVSQACVSAHGYGWTIDQTCEDNFYAAIPAITPPRPASGAAYIIKLWPNSIASWLVDSDGTAHPIPDGSTYICLAHYVPVWYELTQDRIDQIVTSYGANATCPPNGLQPASFTSSNPAIANTLLRVIDSSGHVKVYVADANGRVAPLWPGDLVFTCEAQQHQLWDYLTPAQLAGLDIQPGIVATADANCLSLN
jgi:helix-hairpin-helix protein